MEKRNIVYIATSLDGFIADRNGDIGWLDTIPIPENEDMGYDQLMNQIDALVMGRTTFEAVLGFDVEWPYKKPVFVLSHSLTNIPDSHKEKAHLIKGTPQEVLAQIHEKGYFRLYIDGGQTIQRFLKEDLIDELIITNFPILLGNGYPLFGEHSNELFFELHDSKVYAGQLVQRHYKRSKKPDN